jgi:NADH:ubiquinone oxidoreductase subunit 6 (subunit J)
VVEFLYLFAYRSGNESVQKALAADEMGTVEYVGKVLFTKFLFPFEVTSLLLLAAIVGVVILAKKKMIE